MASQSVNNAEIAGTAPQIDFSLWGLFWQADIVVKLVMLILVAASVWSWAIILRKRALLKRVHGRAGKFEDAFWSGEPLDKLYQRIKKNAQDPMMKVFAAGMEEWQHGLEDGVDRRPGIQPGFKDRLAKAMDLTLGREMTRAETGLTVLASIGSSAPFIGLFGTVWGIMGSFTAIAQSQNTNLAVVAPGIAEALFATALGLVAAIPAVIGYNTLSAGLGRYAERVQSFAIEFTTILHRHLEQISTTQPAAYGPGTSEQNALNKDTKEL